MYARENMNQNYYVHCYIIGWHGNSMRNHVSSYLNKNQFRETFKQVTKYGFNRFRNTCIFIALFCSSIKTS